MNKILADVRKRVQPATGTARSISWQLSPCMQMTGFADCKAVSLCKGGEQQLTAKPGSVSPEKWLFTPLRAPSWERGTGPSSSCGEAVVLRVRHDINR